MKQHRLFYVLLLGGLLLAGAAGCAGGNPLISDAESSLEAQNYEQALQSVKQAIAKDSANAQAYLLKGRILYQQAGQVETPQRHLSLVQKAVEAWEHAVALNSEVRGQVEMRTLTAYQREFQRGAKAFNTASADTAYLRAAAHFGGASLIRPDSARAARYQAYAYVNAGRREQAIEPLQDLVDLGAADTTDYALLGKLYLQTNQPDQAIAVLEQGLEQYPGSRDIQSSLLTAYLQTGRTEDAMDRYATLVEQEPNNPTYRYNYGSLLLEAERYEDAIEQLETATELDPDYAAAYYNLGAAYVNRAVQVNERIGALNDSLQTNQQQLSQQEVEEISARLQELDAQRTRLFEQAVPPLERARELAQAGDVRVQMSEICRALFTAYVQTEQSDKAQTVQECAGMG